MANIMEQKTAPKSKARNLAENRQPILTTLFIGLAFFWTCSAYLSWTGHLAPLASDTVTYMATEAGGSVAQAAGLLAFVWLLRYDAGSALRSKLIIWIMLLDGCAALSVLFSDEMAQVLVWGIVMNLLHGAIAGYYIARLSFFIPQNRRALCFGIGYALGNTGSYLLSLAGGGGFLGTDAVGWVYIALILLNIGLYLYLGRIDRRTGDNATSGSDELSDRRITKNAIPLSSCALAGAVVVLLGLTSQLLFFFPAQAYLSNTVSLNFSHLFYAVGLVIAAVVNDKKRSAGLILALLSLCFPVLSLSLYRLPGLLTVLAVAGYAVSGFFTVYRIVVFTDLYDDDSRLLFLAPAGLICGRLGEACGAVLGFFLSSRHIALTLITALLFTASIILVFMLYIRLYSFKPVTTAPERMGRFYAQYDLSAREQQVFLLLADGKTNQEIAEALFISENTVKFHVRSILKKTGCQKRTEVVRKFQSFS